MRSIYRVMLGQKSVYAAECFAGGFIGADYEIDEDLTGKLPEEWREFNAAYIPVYLKNRPDKSKIAAGLACGSLWTIGKGIQPGDVVLCPDGLGKYHVGEVTGPITSSRAGFCRIDVRSNGFRFRSIVPP